jgi:hypothetical protein
MMLGMYRCWERFSAAHWSSALPALVLLKVGLWGKGKRQEERAGLEAGVRDGKGRRQ